MMMVTAGCIYLAEERRTVVIMKVMTEPSHKRAGYSHSRDYARESSYCRFLMDFSVMKSAHIGCCIY